MAAFFQPALLPALLAELREALANAASEYEKEKAAINIIHEFHSFFGVEGTRSDMWQLLSSALAGSGPGHLNNADDRYNLLFFYEFVLVFFDAVYVLHNKEKDGPLKNL